MKTNKIPYGSSGLEINVPSGIEVDWVMPPTISPMNDQMQAVAQAVKSSVSGRLEDFCSASRISIAINDKTRPVPHHILLPPLLDHLERIGISPARITLYIATGSHKAMREDEFPLILPVEILQKYKVVSHNVDDVNNFTNLGTTSRGTPVHVNKDFYQADLRIVVGDIELHHFAGFSGGVKSAVIGLGSRDLIQHNHVMLTHEKAAIGVYEDNPLRQDIEEAGDLIGIHFALNAILNEEKQVIEVFFGKPRDVMRYGIQVARKLSAVPKTRDYDLVIASAGGFPKDINLYQAQKAISHARLFAKKGGVIILAAECREGPGSQAYEDFMNGVSSIPEIFGKFSKMGFVVGAHKAVQIARQLETHTIILVSSMPAERVKSLLLIPAQTINEAIQIAVENQPGLSSMAVLPYATGVYPA